MAEKIIQIAAINHIRRQLSFSVIGSLIHKINIHLACKIRRGFLLDHGNLHSAL